MQNSTAITIPRHLICPVSQEFFLQPVTVMPSGHTFEKEIIEQLLENATHDKPAVCPLTRKPIVSYVTAWSIAAAVDDFIKANPNVEQYKRIKPENLITEQTASSAPTTSAESSTNQFNETLQQIQDDESLARELAMEEVPTLVHPTSRQTSLQLQLHVPARPSQSSNFFRPSAQHRAAPTAATSSNSTTNHMPTIQLTSQEERELNTLVSDIKNIIYALKFEKGPQPRNPIQNDSLIFFAIIAQVFLEPLPWQKIVVSQGPKTLAMYEVLKAAIRALEELNPSIFEQAKSQHARQFDVVKTWFAGEKSLGNDGYASFAKTMGTIQNQPGYLVDQILIRVNFMLADLKLKYNIEPETTQNTFNMSA